MPPSETDRPHEVSAETIEIRQDAAITIQEALIIAAEEFFPIGKSTLQRWAKVWAERSAASPVKSLLVTNRAGSIYRLDRDEFKAWIFDQKENMRPGETLQDPVGSRETPRDPARPRQTSQGPERPHETTSGAATNSDATHKLRDENMQLKIDVEVRKQLLNQAVGEITRQRDQIEGLLRENGALQSRVLQLSAGPQTDRPNLPPADASEHGAAHTFPHENVDNSAPINPTAV